MTIITDEKQVGENYIAQFDFQPRLLSGETLQDVTSITPTLVDGSGLVTVTSLSHDGDSLAQGKVSGGVDGSRYLLTCIVETSLGATYEAEMYLDVRNKP